MDMARLSQGDGLKGLTGADVFAKACELRAGLGADARAAFKADGKGFTRHIRQHDQRELLDAERAAALSAAPSMDDLIDRM